MEDPQPSGDATAGSAAVTAAAAAGAAGAAAERQRRAEEAMEQMMMAQELAQEEEDGDDDDDDLDDLDHQDDPENHGDGDWDHADDNNDNNGGDGDGDGDGPHPNDAGQFPLNGTRHGIKAPRFTYVQISFFAAFALIYYAYRSRQQWYLALVFLSSSKWAYIIMGNALIATLIAFFQIFTRLFFNGLRLAEAEGLGDFFRWNITETCLALTIFRSELDVKTGILFLIFVLAKCLHWVADMRLSQLRMTEEVLVARPGTVWPALRWSHVKLLNCLFVLQFLDILAVMECGQDILERGPSVSILFAFEGAIMLTSVVSCVLLWTLHLVDGIVNCLHETTSPGSAAHRWIHPWHDYKATLVFAVEVQAQAVKFVAYITFFAIVMTYYGLPINLIREVYISFQQLKQRLTAFGKYRTLMASMNRFANPTAEQLEEEHTCIICRDEMTVEAAKRLPGCGHIFHKSCLREWLVQQQTCPTCRGDISAMEARQRQAELNNARAQAREAEQQREHGEIETEGSGGDQRESRAEEEKPAEPRGECNARVGATKEPSPSEGPTTKTKVAFPDSNTSNLSSQKSSTVSFSGLPEEDDRKLAPASPNRGKRVRIVDPASQFDKNFSNDNESAFPAFYRVVQDDGASVYNDGDAVSFIIRIVPFGVVLVGQELAWRDCDGEKRMMLRMPDGWICENDVERVVAVPFGM